MSAASRPFDLLKIIQAGIKSVRPQNIFPKLFSNPAPALEEWMNGRPRFLLTIGKASLGSAAAVLSECAVDDYFIIAPASNIAPAGLDSRKINRGSHPVPDRKSLTATNKLQRWLRQLPEGGYLLAVISGGASALVVSPLAGISLQDKTKVNRLLLKSGASIHEMNVVRKHLSSVKGGRLALQTAKQRTVVIALSDVIGDDFATIGSGPFYPDLSTFKLARSILDHYEIWKEIPAAVRTIIQKGISGKIPESPKKFDHPVPHIVIASNKTARWAASEEARALGYRIRMIKGEIRGLVENVAQRLSIELRKLPERSVLIAGGEITVRLKGNGKGGRNQHLALLLTTALAGSDVAFAAAGTDGIDGNSPAAGAWTDGATKKRAIRKNLNPEKAATQFNSFIFFRALDQTIETGPTGTNVMDLYIGLRR